MAKFRNTHKYPLTVNLPGRSISVPGRGVFSTDWKEAVCADVLTKLAKGMLARVPDDLPPEPDPAPVLPKSTRPVSLGATLSDSPGPSTEKPVAPTDDQDLSSPDQPGEGATDLKTERRRRR